MPRESVPKERESMNREIATERVEQYVEA